MNPLHQSAYETDDEEDEEDEETEAEEDELFLEASAFAEFTIGGDGSILDGARRTDPLGLAASSDDEYETSVEEILRLRPSALSPTSTPKSKTISPREPSPPSAICSTPGEGRAGGHLTQLLFCHTGTARAGHQQPVVAIGAAVQAVIRSILQSGTDMVRLKLGTLAEQQRQKVGGHGHWAVFKDNNGTML